jgi:hypothetical protein
MKKHIWTIILVATLGLSSSDAYANRYNGSNDYCREYTGTIYVGGRAQQGYGTACLQPDGSWQVVSGDNVGQAVAPNYIINQPEPVVYYQPPRNVYRTTYYRPRDVGTSISVSFNDDDWRRDRWRHHRHHRYDRWDRYDDRHHGRIHRSGNTLSWR